MNDAILAIVLISLVLQVAMFCLLCELISEWGKAILAEIKKGKP